MKTKRVRIIGYIDPEGNYNLACRSGVDEKPAWGIIADGMPDDSTPSTWRRVVIEADVPLPEATPVVVEGRVSDG